MGQSACLQLKLLSSGPRVLRRCASVCASRASGAYVVNPFLPVTIRLGMTVHFGCCGPRFGSCTLEAWQHLHLHLQFDQIFGYRVSSLSAVCYFSLTAWRFDSTPSFLPNSPTSSLRSVPVPVRLEGPARFPSGSLILVDPAHSCHSPAPVTVSVCRPLVQLLGELALPPARA